MRQVEQAYITSVFAKQAAPRSLVAGLLGAGLGGASTYLTSKGSWRKRLRNALIGAGVGAAGGVGLDYASRRLAGKTNKLVDKVGPAVERKFESAVIDRVVKHEMSKTRNGDPGARIYVGPQAPHTPADLDREAKELNASRDLSALLRQQKQPEVVGAHQRVLDRVAEADKRHGSLLATRDVLSDTVSSSAQPATSPGPSPAEIKARRNKLYEAGNIANELERERLLSLSPWQRRIHELLTGVPAEQATKDPFRAWTVPDKYGNLREIPADIIEDYLARNRKPDNAMRLARR